jgi:hypothetical protein
MARIGMAKGAAMAAYAQRASLDTQRLGHCRTLHDTTTRAPQSLQSGDNARWALSISMGINARGRADLPTGAGPGVAWPRVARYMVLKDCAAKLEPWCVVRISAQLYAPGTDQRFSSNISEQLTAPRL